MHLERLETLNHIVSSWEKNEKIEVCFPYQKLATELTAGSQDPHSSPDNDHDSHLSVLGSSSSKEVQPAQDESLTISQQMRKSNAHLPVVKC